MSISSLTEKLEHLNIKFFLNNSFLMITIISMTNITNSSLQLLQKFVKLKKLVLSNNVTGLLKMILLKS